MAEDRSPTDSLLIYLLVILPVSLAFWSSLNLEDEGCKAFRNVLVILIGLCWVVKGFIQRLRKDVPVLQDEEALFEPPDWLPVPAVGVETSFMYAKLKRRLWTYKYQQDD